MIPDDGFLFVGYAPKRLHDPEWPIVDLVASVSGCISEGADYEDETRWWDFNRARFYNSVHQALAACQGEPPAVFAYWLSLTLFDSEADDWAPLDLDRFFEPDDPSFPASPEGSGVTHGFDVVAHYQMDFDPVPGGAPVSNWTWGCSPLSCNGYANEQDWLTVNRMCLLPTYEAAREAQKLMQKEQPEPGTYMVIRIDAA